jgi:hypothetical protein
MLGENDGQYWSCRIFLFLGNDAVMPELGWRNAGAPGKPQDKNAWVQVLDYEADGGELEDPANSEYTG